MRVLFITGNNEIWKEKKRIIKEKYPLISFYDVYTDDRKRSVEIADVIIGMPTEQELDYADNLKLIIVPWTGINRLPVEKLTKRNILVMNNHANAKIVAERALALCLTLMGKIIFLHDKLKLGIWGGRTKYKPVDRRWTTLYNKKVSIIGFGNIGRELVKLLKPFNCKILGFKREETNNEEIKITYNLNEALDFGEILFFFLPLTEETVDLINDNNKLYLRNKFIVNIGRGEVINEETLYKLLESGLLRGAALDTWYNYPKNGSVTLPSIYPIHTFDNVVLSPHCASGTYEAQESMAQETINNLIDYIEKRPLRNLVDLNRKY